MQKSRHSEKQIITIRETIFVFVRRLQNPLKLPRGG